MAVEQCRRRLRGTGRRLRAVVEELPDPPAVEGPLSGLPYVVKDMIGTGLTAPSWGCAQPKQNVSPAADIVGLLSKAGACLIATSEMTELAYEPSGINPSRGNVLNPWNVEFVPGGSSSGSAALVASGCCFAALGSDTGGSVRIPAHCCGVTALKPSWGEIPVAGTMPLSPSLDTIGVLARSASDIAKVWGAVTPRLGRPHISFNTAAILEDTFADCDLGVAKSCRAAIDVLAQIGMQIVKRNGFPEEADRNSLIVMQAEAARSNATRLDDERIDAVLRKRLRKGLSITDDQLARTLAERARLCGEFQDRYLRSAAIAVLPVMPIRTPRVDEVDPASPGFTARTLYALSRYTRFINYLGLPALAIPVGFDDRHMPVGLQLVGSLNSEAVLLEIGQKFQAMTDWHGRVPRAVAGDIAAEEGIVA